MDFRAYVREYLQRLPIAHEAEIVEELAQHLEDIYREGRDAGLDHDAAWARAAGALPAAADDLARALRSASRTPPGRVADRWRAALDEPVPSAPGVFSMFTGLRRDCRYAVRTLLRESGLHGRHRDHAGPRDRRDRRGVQRRGRRAVEERPGRRPGSRRQRLHRLGRARDGESGRRRPGGDLFVSRLRRPARQRRARRPRRVCRHQPDARHRRPHRANRRAGRERQLLRRRRRASRRRPYLQPGGGPHRLGGPCRRAVARAVAAPLRRRDRHRRPIDHAQRQRLHGHRHRAARVRRIGSGRRAGSLGADGAAGRSAAALGRSACGGAWEVPACSASGTCGG